MPRSQPPIRREVDSTKLTHSNSQSGSLHDSFKCLSSAALGEDINAESVIESIDYTGVVPKDRLSNMKEEVEEYEERQSVKMEREDGVKDAEGLKREQEEGKGKGVTDVTCQTHKCEKNGVKSEYCQQDMEQGSNLVTACLMKQPRVLIRRLKMTGNSGHEPLFPAFVFSARIKTV